MDNHNDVSDRFPTLIDRLVSITIDFVRFLSNIEEIDLLRSDFFITKV